MASSSSDERQQPTYETLLAKVLKGDLTIDFAAFRLAYTRTEEFCTGAFLSRQDVSEIEVLCHERDFSNALALAEKALAKNFADVNAHYVAAIAFMCTGNEKVWYHRNLFEKLLESIKIGCDGKTLETAYVVISVPEEYALLDHLGYKMEMQALLVPGNGHRYDRMTVVNRRTNEKAVLYFQIDAVFSAGNQKCANCYKPECFLGEGNHLMRCSNCHKVKYCSKDCQREHWKKAHKDQCQGKQN
jgi:hypothetical protein